MAEMTRQERIGLLKRKIHLEGVLPIGASGAVGTLSGTNAAALCGVTWVKTSGETGRYTGTLFKTFSKVQVTASLEGPTDAAMGNTDANAVVVRNVGTSSFEIQTLLASSGADTNTTSGNKIHWFAVCEE